MSDNETRDAHSDSPPDRGAAGDVSTTGHSDRDTSGFSSDTSKAGPTTGHASTDDAHGDDGHAGHGNGDDHGQGGHGGRGGDDASDVPTIVPTTWGQLIFPALILVLVAILVAGPISNAFQSRPAPFTPVTENRGNTGEGENTTEPTAIPEQPVATPETHSSVVTPVVAATPPAPIPSTANLSSPTPLFNVLSTKTAVAISASTGDIARAPVRLDFGGRSFVVKAGDTLLPDWQPPQDQGIATWIEKSVANHILYLSYSAENAALFKAGKKGDKISLSMNTGQVFEFEVNRSERVFNGPPTNASQFTVTTAMAQDHAGVTLFLIGDSSSDRAVVQADFTGNIQ